MELVCYALAVVGDGLACGMWVGVGMVALGSLLLLLLLPSIGIWVILRSCLRRFPGACACRSSDIGTGPKRVERLVALHLAYAPARQRPQYMPRPLPEPPLTYSLLLQHRSRA